MAGLLPHGRAPARTALEDARAAVQRSDEASARHNLTPVPKAALLELRSAVRALADAVSFLIDEPAPSPGVRAEDGPVPCEKHRDTSRAWVDCPDCKIPAAGETDQRTWIWRKNAESPWYGNVFEADHADALRREGFEVAAFVPESEFDRALRERDEAREALSNLIERVLDMEAMPSQWRKVHPHIESARAVLRAAGSEEENRG